MVAWKGTKRAKWALATLWEQQDWRFLCARCDNKDSRNGLVFILRAELGGERNAHLQQTHTQRERERERERERNKNYVNASIPKDYVKKLFSWNYSNTSKHYFREVILINKFLTMCDSFSLNKMTIFINIAPIKFLTNHWSHGAHFVIFENFAPHQTLFSSSSIDFSS